MEQNAYLKKIYKISNLTSIFRRRIGMLVSGRALAQLVESLLQMLGYTPSIEQKRENSEKGWLEPNLGQSTTWAEDTRR